MSKGKDRFKTNLPESQNSFSASKVSYYTKKPVFSFKDFRETNYYTKEHSNGDKHSLFNFLNGSQGFCNMTWYEIKSKPKMFHFHDIPREKIKLDSLPENWEFLQFKLPNHDSGRFGGYFDENCIFHIVFYDKEHLVFERK